jgi:hypothetical protein
MTVVPSAGPPEDQHEEDTEEIGGNEPILTADELRALLAEQPISSQDDEGA